MWDAEGDFLRGSFVLGLAVLSCIARPSEPPEAPSLMEEPNSQERCDQAEAAGLIWTGELTQQELADSPDDFVGYDSQLGCYYVD